MDVEEQTLRYSSAECYLSAYNVPALALQAEVRVLLRFHSSSMLAARAVKTWTRRHACRAYSYGLLRGIKPGLPLEESSRPSEDASRHTEGRAHAGPSRITLEDVEEKQMDAEARRKQRQTEWKRRQGVSTNLLCHPIRDCFLSLCSLVGFLCEHLSCST